MEIHRYQIKVYADQMSFIHGFMEEQYRVYVPGQGVLGYRKNVSGKKIVFDFVSQDKNDIAEYEEAIKGELVVNGVKAKYLGKTELPDELVLKVLSEGRLFNEAMVIFEKSANGLVNLIRE